MPVELWTSGRHPSRLQSALADNEGQGPDKLSRHRIRGDFRRALSSYFGPGKDLVVVCRFASLSKWPYARVLTPRELLPVRTGRESGRSIPWERPNAEDGDTRCVKY